ncbi:MAG: hypothetical protein AVDCRST_MAG71-181, partial [uncultured Lysobacter sp.]
CPATWSRSTERHTSSARVVRTMRRVPTPGWRLRGRRIVV